MAILALLTTGLKTLNWVVPELLKDERERRGPKTLDKVKLYIGSYRRSKEFIRVSASYLFRIKIDDRYLLIKGRRIDQYQPVGGVYKYHQDAAHDVLQKLDVRDDELVPIDDSSRSDLRIRVRGKNIISFVRWFLSEKDRETTQQREFHEELVVPGYLSSAFNHVDTRYLYTVWRPLTYSHHSSATELMIYQVFDLKLTLAQENELRNLQLPPSGDLRWVTEKEIKQLGADQIGRPEMFRIGLHAQYLLSPDG